MRTWYVTGSMEERETRGREREPPASHDFLVKHAITSHRHGQFSTDGGEDRCTSRCICICICVMQVRQPPAHLAARPILFLGYTRYRENREHLETGPDSAPVNGLAPECTSGPRALAVSEHWVELGGCPPVSDGGRLGHVSYPGSSAQGCSMASMESLPSAPRRFAGPGHHLRSTIPGSLPASRQASLDALGCPELRRQVV